MTRLALGTISLSALLFATSCGSDEQAPVAPPAGTAQVISVTPCLEQVVPGTGGKRVVDLVVPDTITVNLSQPSGFPNGRRLQDPVIDITLAVIFLDMNRHGPSTFVNLPLNPPSNDRMFRTEFPFLALPQGTPPRSGSDTATAFDFVDAPASAYARVDRTGMPAVSPALVGGPLKNAYNDAGPGEDSAFVFAAELSAQLQLLQEALLDDFRAAGLTTCAAVR